MSAPTAVDGFAARVRASTRAAHTAAEGSPFLDDLLAGRLGPAAHAAMLAQLHPVYAALEGSAAALVAHPVVAPFLDERLVRLPRLESDLAHLLGPAWRAALQPSRATAAYARHLAGAAHDPVRFVVHHYLRSLGDLSGGQAVATLLAREYGMGAESLSFYAFDDVAPAPYRARYRALLDAAAFTPAEHDDFVAEAEAGYAVNRAVLDELAAVWCRP